VRTRYVFAPLLIVLLSSGCGGCFRRHKGSLEHMKKKELREVRDSLRSEVKALRRQVSERQNRAPSNESVGAKNE